MNEKRRILLKTALKAGGLLLLGAGTARAQTQFPAKPLRYIVPVPAGGGADMIARVVCERWGRILGQSMVVDNVSGASGTIACQSTMRAAPDGYTLLQGYVGTHGTNPATRKVPYDAVKDFTPVGMIGGTPNVLVVGAGVPAKSLADFVDHARRNSGKVSYGSAGQGSLTHLTMELFSHQLDLSLIHVPYRGIAPAFTDLLGGQTQAMFPGLAAAMPHIRSGRVVPLAVTGLARHPLIKDVPTLDESGLKGFDAMQWYGVVGPARMPAEIVMLLNEKLNAVLAAADLREKLASEAVEPMPMTPDQFGNFIKLDIARWSKLAKDRKIDLDA
jgi:tripartite-type tricarboxylate transporter receptor subunit TctC